MKKVAKILTIVFVIVALMALSFGLVACNNDEDESLRFAAPQGTPALAMLRLVTDNKTIGGEKVEYAVVNPENIGNEMSGAKSDIIIMPVNGGANMIRTGADYKLVSVAVDGSLYMVGNKQGGGAIGFDDIKGKKIACIGQTGVPGLVFRYVMAQNGINIITSGEPDIAENQVLVQYVSAAPYAMSLMSDGAVDFAVVGEPAATQFKNALSLNAEMDMQLEYSRVNPTANGETYPQAGLFVRTALANNEAFMNSLFSALDASKQWVAEHPADVQSFAASNLYEAAKFPTPSIARCAINCSRIDEDEKDRIVAFLKNVMPAANGNPIDWDSAKALIF